ncbi:MAG: DUF4058 family protein [Phototrophicaceae bacterium]
MAVRSATNQYRGINAHLHSFFQAHGGWSSFHTSFIAALARDLNRLLPSGYVVDIEQSLQIREVHPDTGERLRRPEPDLTIFRTPQASAFPPSGATVATLTQTIAATFDLTEELYYRALVIYQLLDSDVLPGQPLTRIELLSPTNKQGAGAVQYQEKRYGALRSGLALIELDWLHETPPTIHGLPHYPDAPNSHAYSITVSDPTPTFDDGHAYTYAFDVDQRIPIVEVPLGVGNSISVDFNPVYDDVYAGLAAYSLRVDYSQPPANMTRYSTLDQKRIQHRMAAVLNPPTPS